MTARKTRIIQNKLDRIRRDLADRRVLCKDGGPGSGNFGHQGRPGQVGGSASTGASTDRGILSFLQPKKKAPTPAKQPDLGAKYSEDRKRSAIWMAPKAKTHDVLIDDTIKVWKSLSDVQRWGVREYTGNNYPRFAKALASDSYKNGTAGKYETLCIKGITEALNRASLPKDTWIDRGATSNAMGKTLQVSQEEVENALTDDKALEQLKAKCVGQRLKQKVFLSGCPKKDAGFQSNYKLKIYAPEGSKVLYAEPFSICGNANSKGWNGEKYRVQDENEMGEFEVLIQRDSDLVIRDIAKIHGKLLVVADAITHEVHDK